MIGKTLSHYKIISKLGQGGMGEVYQATDTRLDRQVAIKILPEGFAASDQSRARFEREAKTISSLNHPNICTLHDVGHEDETEYLVMELIEGDLLSKRLAAGPLPLPEVFRYGAQIADALDCAHKQGIVHRDLKPDNVILTRSGAKLLDFGLARIASEAAPVVGLTHQTVTSLAPLTEEGTIVGTFQYMAPEQLEGQEAGGRTDIFALGALLYEMATGRRAFQGETRTSLIASIVTAHPPAISTVLDLAPPAFDHVVRKCLEKNPDDRWQSAHDVATQLRWISEAGSEAGVAKAVASTRRLHRRALVALAATGWLLAAAALVWLGMTTLGRDPVARPEVRTFSWPVEDLDAQVVSPDGRWLAYVAGGYLHFRQTDEADVRRLEDSRGVRALAWSPNSSSVAYITNRSADGSRLTVPELRRVTAGGPSSTTIARIDDARSLAFGSPDVVHVAVRRRGGARILAVPFGGGEPEPYIEPPEDGPGIVAPGGFAFLPDGETLLCVIDEKGRRSIALREADSKFQTLVPGVEDGFVWGPIYSTTGHVLYVRRDSRSAPPAIWALPFDAGKREALGPPQLVMSAAAGVSASKDGSLYFARLPAERGPEQLVWVDREGRIGDTIGQPQKSVTSPALSPDGRLVAVRGHEDDDTQDVWLHDVTRSIKTRLSYGVINTWRPAWSPDGRRIAFQSRDNRDWFRSDIYVQDTDGRSAPEVLVATDLDEYGPHWSPDGRFILYTVSKEDGDRDLWVVEADGSAEPRAFLASRFSESMPFLSPDGRYVAYHSDRTGQHEIFVTTFPEPGRELQISTNGGGYAQWGTNEIFYVEPDPESLMAVEVQTSPELRLGNPVKLFAEDDVDVILSRGSTFDFGITPAGDRFVLTQDLSPKKDETIAVLQNWVETLAAR